MTTAIEVVTFKLLETATKEQLLDTCSEMEQFLRQQDGFYYRSLSQNDEGMWYDIIYWRDQAAAQAGGEAFMASDTCARMMTMIDGPSCILTHMDALSEVKPS